MDLDIAEKETEEKGLEKERGWLWWECSVQRREVLRIKGVAIEIVVIVFSCLKLRLDHPLPCHKISSGLSPEVTP